MRVEQQVFRGVPTSVDLGFLAGGWAQLILVFASPGWLQALQAPLAQAAPAAVRMGCCTAGEISSRGVSDDTAVVTAVSFDRVQVRAAVTRLAGMADAQAAGERLAQGLPADGLRAVLLLSQGVGINGSALLQGMKGVLGGVPIAGGLAGDVSFQATWVLTPEGLSQDQLVAVGLYGDALQFDFGCYGGWTPFGPARKVTRSEHNVLYELDGEPALEIYKRYLGSHAQGLPGSGLLFPFAMLGEDDQEVGLVRTILGVNEAEGSVTLAGDIDPDGYLRLMHASTDALVDGAGTAAQQSATPRSGPGLALLVSCVGRKLVMGDRVDEEVEAVADVFGPGVTLTGFYSNGEVSPAGTLLDCKLHNQTMTIARLHEA
ncbi:FIST signal transduction protein [Roseateles sp. BYS87W]|uniref:FIST signal transduction protein n=1 Tax=Pelomonas baiyunensis TaxID=3299026 RepID=A0ABW7GZZ8_9BURK